MASFFSFATDVKIEKDWIFGGWKESVFYATDAWIERKYGVDRTLCYFLDWLRRCFVLNFVVDFVSGRLAD